MVKKKYAIMGTVVLIVTLVLVLILNLIAPTQCAICSELKRHAPCLLNLNTGAIGELEIYEPHPYKVGEISEKQDSSTFSFVSVVGIRGTRTSSPWELKLNVPMNGDRTQSRHYCFDCREVLSDYKKGYVVLDLYNPEKPTVLPIYDGATYSIRCYSVSISVDEKNQAYELKIVGTLDTQ